MDLLTLALVAVAVAVVAGVILIGLYVWNGLALGALLHRIGGRGWTAWVPILGDVELLRRAGGPGWPAVLLLVPIAAVYGLYRKAIAALRIGEWFGAGSGWAFAAILLPPLWATVLGRRADPGAGALAARLTSARDYPGAVTIDEPAAGPTRLPETAAEVVPPPPGPPSLVDPPAPTPIEPPAPAAPPAPPVAAPPAPAPPVADSPSRELPPPPVVLPPPPPVTAVQSGPAEAPAPEASVAPAHVAPAHVEPAPVAPAPVAPAPLADPPPPAPVSPAPPAPEAAPSLTPVAAGLDDDDAGETVVVDRRPVVLWTLHVDGGPSIPLSGERVLLGRKPFRSDPSAVEVAIPDTTRTLSKVHAVLELEDGRWTVTDLDSTNGVVVIEADGSERLLEPGGSAPVLRGFVLGKVGMHVSFDGGAAP